MIIQPIDYFLVVWFVLAALSTAYVAWDQFRNNPEPVVMKWGFVLVTLYMGPLGPLFKRIRMTLPAPIGLGPAMEAMRESHPTGQAAPFHRALV